MQSKAHFNKRLDTLPKEGETPYGIPRKKISWNAQGSKKPPVRWGILLGGEDQSKKLYSATQYTVTTWVIEYMGH